jgi:flavin reductase (DIM6/NTAB) family NADH-FMN oxidoreductase RutF
VSSRGVTNVAPYSFYTVASTNPPILSVTQVNPSDGSTKDTLSNLLETKECQVNLVTQDLAEIMNGSSGSYPRDTSEFDLLGIPTIAGQKVQAPGVAPALARMECKLREVIHLGNGSVMFLDVLQFIVDERVQSDAAPIDNTKMVAVGKIGGNGYATTKDMFELERPRV